VRGSGDTAGARSALKCGSAEGISIVDWSWLVGGYHHEIVASGKQPVLLLLIGLIAGFGFIRTSTRMIRAQVKWWPGNISAGGVHLHHEIFGVLLMLATGAISFGVTTVHPWRDLLGFLFGIGAGLVLDEFALLLRLQDVYWTKEGRTSIDAVIVAVILTAMLLVRTAPFGVHDVQSDERAARWLTVGIVAVNLALALLTAFKGKFWLMLLATYVPIAGIVGAVRLAKPDSPWSRWRYDATRRARAAARNVPWSRRQARIISLIGGAPSQPDPEPSA
jgi:hypothetical protein